MRPAGPFGIEESQLRILLTNDDGVYAPGLRALRTELQKLGDVLVVAPATEQSAAGHSVTITAPLVVWPDSLPRSFARPKSVIFGVPSAFISTLAGLRSRCTMPCS